jgi:thiamine-phosphate pyrophosphorylase
VKRPVDWGLYLVTDRRLAGSRPIEEVVRAAVRGGVTAVQLRDKEAGTREFVDLARRLKTILAPLGVPLIINDRIDVALAAGADGVHLGQSDMGYGDARRLLGPDAILGLSVDNAEQAEQAEPLDLDYLGVGPVFPTATKTDTAPVLGLEGLASVRQASRHILVAIGGIHASNAAAVMQTGVDCIAVVSAICSAPDPEAAARKLRQVVDSNRTTPRAGCSGSRGRSWPDRTAS